MSVYIKGMDMPKDCKECFFLGTGYGGQWWCYAIIDAQVSVYDGQRNEKCPLVEVKPHGDLIDRDALTSVTEMVNGEFKTYYEKFEIDDAPVVVKSEE